MQTVTAVDGLREVLQRYVSSVTARSLVDTAIRRAGMSHAELQSGKVSEQVIVQVLRGIEVFLRDERQREVLAGQLRALSQKGTGHLVREKVVPIHSEDSVVTARARARDLAAEVGFQRTEQVKIATAVSEVARNILRYAGGDGEVTVKLISRPRNGISIAATDRGPGIPDINHVLSGAYVSRTGMGMGLLGCRKLMDQFHVETGPGKGTIVVMEKYL